MCVRTHVSVHVGLDLCGQIPSLSLRVKQGKRVVPTSSSIDEMSFIR